MHVLGGQAAVVLDEIEVDVVAVVLERDEDVDRAQAGLELAGDAPVVEKGFLAPERGAEPDLEAETPGEVLEQPEIARAGLGQVEAVDDQGLGPEAAVDDHGLERAQDLFGPGRVLLEVHDDPVADELVEVVQGRAHLGRLGQLFEDVLVPGHDVVDAAGVGDVDDRLPLEELVGGDVDEAGRLADALAAGQDADVAPAEAAGDRSLEDPQGAALDEFFFDRERHVRDSVLSVSSWATFAGTRPYFRNSIVNSALPWVRERR